MSFNQTNPTASTPYIVDATLAHTHTVILLHGLGSNGEKFGRELLETGITSSGQRLTQLLPHAKFVFPTARWRRSSAFGRSLLTQWFDIARLPDPSYRCELQLKGLAESTAELLPLLQAEQDAGIAPQRLVLGGISQGCAMALSLLLALPHPVAAFVGMSGYLPFQADLDDAVDDTEEDGDEDSFFAVDGNEQDGRQAQREPAVRATVFERDLLELPPVDVQSTLQTACATPIFLGHGADDEKVPPALGSAMAATLGKAGFREVEFKVYSGVGHWYKIPDEIDDIAQLLCRALC